ncbi:MAG TPA: CinA family nicotinamide mononucleotide deamidase-related protein, partial [Roseiflexaceae bacterium]|nr:CinA family nicotinamide mononucleotide deamidase-related protein [Roseiflexaceae bacterium]
MKAEILAVGSELLLGETIDTNSAYLARSLAALGIGLFRKAVVGDNEERVASMIAEALERVDLLVITGGLGPTPDDITREAVARALGQPLQFHQHLLDQIEARFRSFGRTMSPSNRQQAFVPQGARIVENPRGTAPSFIVEDERGTVMVLPGVPSEMRYLWENAMTPYLRDERGATSSILVRTIHATGLSESYIGELLADLMLHDNPTLGISAKRAQYELRIGARADTLAQATLLADEAERIIRERMGEHVIGAETLEQATLSLLGEQGLSVALDEATLDAPLFRMLAGNATGRKLLRGASITPAADVRDSAAAREQA